LPGGFHRTNGLNQTSDLALEVSRHPYGAAQKDNPEEQTSGKNYRPED
jgi:hypothetical protein